MTTLETTRARLLGVSPDGPGLLPLNAGEQYRFGFEMDACIGCHSCEVACAEQNGNPVDVKWRRVGEIEGGSYPDTRRFNLSMACNQCLEPACLEGCPTNAYVKLENGIVAHHAEDCIGCQYCIWNCPYEVPAFNPQRRIVTKCDMCLPRIDAGLEPACVLACPTEAIKLEKVDVAAWRDDHRAAEAPGLPPSSITLSTTRITLPANVPAETLAASDHQVEPADPHWPLVALTLLTQLAVGTVAGTVLLELLTVQNPGPAASAQVVGPGAAAAFVAGAMAMAVSILHLGQPARALKAFRNLRRSWLSREVALFSAFAAASMAYAVSALVGSEATLGLGLASVVVGVAGVYASGRLYLVPARPAWNSPRTIVSFFATAVGAGPLLALLVVSGESIPAAWVRLLLVLAAAGAGIQLATYQHLAASVVARREREYRGTARLLFRHFRGRLAMRIASGLAATALLVGAVCSRPGGPAMVVLGAAALGFLAVGEVIGRWLFYVTVVPMTTAGTFFRGRA